MLFDETSISTQPGGGFTCRACSSELIQPLEWEQPGAEEWSVLVRCPECFRLGELHLTTDQVHQFRNILDEASHSIEETADMLDLQVFRETCDDFARMLRNGLVCPMDF